MKSSFKAIFQILTIACLSLLTAGPMKCAARACSYTCLVRQRSCKGKSTNTFELYHCFYRTLSGLRCPATDTERRVAT